VNRISISFAALFLLIMTVSTQLAGYAIAQDYPSRTITIIVPFPAGGSTDAIARILSEHMQASLGQSVIIEMPEAQVGASVSAASRAPHQTATPSTLASGTPTS
jgi:tripartite-type tricarboxylate transporter receptor subunit TctC